MMPKDPGGPLKGLRVLDLTRVLAGPTCTQMLGDLGAEILKIERPGSGDDTRGFAPPTMPGTEESAYFLGVNRNKRSITLDIASPEGQAICRQLLADCDILVENFKVGALAKYGLGYGELRGEFPGLIYCSITGFGQTGPYAPRPGYDSLIQAMGGVMSLTGEPDGLPQKVGVPVADLFAGLYGAIGILAALRHRDATGEGQRVQVDLFSCLLASLVNQGSAYTLAGVVPGRMGNAHPSISPYELYPTGEGELVLAVGNERQFAALCEVLCVPELATDSRFDSNSSRVANRDELKRTLIECLGTRPAAEWAAALTEARVPAGVVNDVAGAFALAQQIGLAPVVDVPDAETGDTVPLTRNPIGLSATPVTYRTAPPPLADA